MIHHLYSYTQIYLSLFEFVLQNDFKHVLTRDQLNKNAPQISILKINPSKIKDVIGSGGKVIRSLTEETGAKIDIEDDGTIKVASSDPESVKLAVEKIEDITAEPEIGEIYSGRVVKTTRG